MTIDEITKTLPNGFHDSDICTIKLDYVKCEATFLIDVDLSSLEEEVDESSRQGELKVTGLLYCVIEPSTYGFPKEYIEGEEKLWLTADSNDFTNLKHCLQKICLINHTFLGFW